MMGKFKGVCTQLLRHIRASRQTTLDAIVAAYPLRTLASFHPSRGCWVVRCVCRRFALILTDALKLNLVPEGCVSLMQDCYSYFSRSPKNKKAMRQLIEVENRRREVASLQNPEIELDEVFAMLKGKYKLPRHIILTRWLSSESAVHVMVLCRDTYTIFLK